MSCPHEHIAYDGKGRAQCGACGEYEPDADDLARKVEDLAGRWESFALALEAVNGPSETGTALRLCIHDVRRLLEGLVT